MKYDIYLYEMAENGLIYGCWFNRAEFCKHYDALSNRWHIDRYCNTLATPENIY